MAVLFWGISVQEIPHSGDGVCCWVPINPPVFVTCPQAVPGKRDYSENQVVFHSRTDTFISILQGVSFIQGCSSKGLCCLHNLVSIFLQQCKVSLKALYITPPPLIFGEL
ncbi:Hypothetical predicted protein [Podarcis lilfordi]|uniref:Uncharacterized protein n=1 Tax=Podarcis lilfordi TaxID=74358 RepID=A0AA35KF14_9SAUR|nr:Hypothetical predicted protein [Podarcis lilfordi]